MIQEYTNLTDAIVNKKLINLDRTKQIQQLRIKMFRNQNRLISAYFVIGYYDDLNEFFNVVNSCNPDTFERWIINKFNCISELEYFQYYYYLMTDYFDNNAASDLRTYLNRMFHKLKPDVWQC